jgi:lipoyl(octanoyl) transferase
MEIKFINSKNLINYDEALNFMEDKVLEISQNKGNELVWLLEHETVFTAGRSFKNEDILNPNLKVFYSNRGGKITLHSPGQKVCYIMLNLKKRANGKIPDPKKFVHILEEIIISTLAYFNIKGEVRKDRIGVWVINKHGIEQKIAAIGVRFTKGVTMHGFAINVNNDLKLFQSFVPCGIKNYGVCSLDSLGKKITMEEFDKILIENLKKYLTNYY